MNVPVVDLSAWTGEVQDDDWNCLWDMGIRGAVVQAYGGRPGGTGPNPHAQQQLAGAARRGMHLAAYTWPSWAWRPALDNLGPFASKIQALALDVEAGAPAHPDQINDLRDAGIRPIIYTSASQWQKIMGNSPYRDTFAELGVDLWVAYYPRLVWDGRWPINVQDGMRYPVDGWSACVGWQFVGTTTLSDETWDLNIFEGSFFTDPESCPDCADLKAEVARLKERVVAIETANYKLNAKVINLELNRYGARTLARQTLDKLEENLNV